MFVCSCLLKSLRYVLTHSAGLWSSAEGKLRTNKIGQVLSLSPQNCSPHSMERKRREDLRQHKQLSQPRLGSQISDSDLLPGICQKYFQHPRLKSKGLLMPGGTVKYIYAIRRKI